MLSDGILHKLKTISSFFGESTGCEWMFFNLLNREFIFGVQMFRTCNIKAAEVSYVKTFYLVLSFWFKTVALLNLNSSIRSKNERST